MEEYNIFMWGNGGSGKTALARQITGDFYNMDTYSRHVLIESKPVQLNIFDAEEYSALQDLYIKQCHGLIIVYSIKRLYFPEYQRFRRTIFRVKDMDIERDTIPIVLVGNKSDLEAERQVSREDGEKLAREWGCPFYEASAKTGHNVEEVFMDVAHQIYQSSEYTCSLFMCHSHATLTAHMCWICIH